ncbi:putative aldehyde dehydrogenase FUS7 [Paramyrothecium foliicola]|nr:putative aldehyde dehydrogenase FUS7 [Paramyrothecium foliicola]
MIDFENFANIINGQLSTTEPTRHGINPSTLEPLPPVPLSGPDEVDAAVDAARGGMAAWAKTPLEERQRAVIAFANAIEDQAEKFAVMLSREQGKPVSEAAREARGAAEALKALAKLPFGDEILEDTNERRIELRYTPIGISVGIVPWNFPIGLAIFKLGPALITGNCIIIKPSPFTPYCGLKLVELAQKFFPPGVVQALSGDDSLGPLLTSHPAVKKVSFTGSTATGIKVLQSCATTMKRVTLELGGNDAAIVCADIDVSSIAPQIATMALYNSGQICIAIKRVYVHASIYEEFLEAVVKSAKSMVVGDGQSKATFLGPVQNQLQYQHVLDLISSIETEKLEVALGDPKFISSQKKGFFIDPMIIDNPPDSARVVTEEPFGPVFPILKWTDEDDVIRRANSSDMGLGASVWSRDVDQAERISKQLEAGTVWINHHSELRPSIPFGGHKYSGLGSELGIPGLKSYCNVQVINRKKE